MNRSNTSCGPQVRAIIVVHAHFFYKSSSHVELIQYNFTHSDSTSPMYDAVLQ